MAVGVLILLGGVITAGVVAGSSSGGTTAAPSSAPIASTAPTTSAPYTVFPTQPATPSAQGWTVRTMFGSENGACRTIAPISGEVDAMACNTTDKIVTYYSQYSGTRDQYVSTKRTGFDTWSSIGEDSCAADYRATLTGTDNIPYQYYVRVYKNSPFAWTESSVIGQVTWQEVVDAPFTVGDRAALCGTP